MNFDTDLICNKRVELAELHVILNYFHQKEQGLSHFINFVLYYYFTSDYAEIANKMIFLHVAGLLTLAIDEHAGIEIIVGHVVADSVVFVSFITTKVLLRLSDSPVIK